MTDTRQRRGSVDAGGANTVDGRAYELNSVVVRYEDRPNRCTVYPRRDSCQERTAAWFSADFDAFVPLDSMR